jgi:predicted signal transduction protein with EAL and GGDEF domain
VDAVRADKPVEADGLPVLEVGLDGVAVIDKASRPVPGMHALRWQRPKQRHQQIGSVHLIMRKPKSTDNRISQRGTQEGAPIVPAALVERDRPHTHRCQVAAESERVQDARRLRTHLDTSTDLANRTRLLVHVHVDAGPIERERSSKAANPTADDPH